ncbi:hypothetical protein ACFOUO_03940 [Salinithrix halophila]|uniref:DinB family protein n=1 Tax=Salinithrix halophila TaxID=1485204 RepID=A0ABV8JF93_9BACL
MANSRFRLDDGLDILSRTPKVLRLMLEGLPNEWIHTNEGKNTWSPFDVLGHLIHGDEKVWMNRIHRKRTFLLRKLGKFDKGR